MHIPSISANLSQKAYTKVSVVIRLPSIRGRSHRSRRLIRSGSRRAQRLQYSRVRQKASPSPTSAGTSRNSPLRPGFPIDKGEAQRAIHLIPVGLGDLPYELGPRHVYCPVDSASLRPRVVPENFHH